MRLLRSFIPLLIVPVAVLMVCAVAVSSASIPPAQWVDTDKKRMDLTPPVLWFLDAVDADTWEGGLEASHINLNDGTVEGLRHRDLSILSIQYHSEASPGPLDNTYLFERFLEMVGGE